MVQITEWSSNFDFELLDALLGRVVVQSNGVVTEWHRKQIMEFVRSLQDGDEKPISFEIMNHGERTSLGLLVFMDDPWSPDVEFFAPVDLIELIEREHEKLCEELGI